MTNLIENAVAPMKAACVDRNVALAREYVERVTVELESCGGDLDVLAPSPRGTMDRNTYIVARAKRGNITLLVRHLQTSRLMSEPCLVMIDNSRVALFLDQVARDAGADFDAYVVKLTNKVGEVVGAKVEGALWQGSRLTVTKADGSIERWNTQQIINISVLGKLFNQWPTRKQK